LVLFLAFLDEAPSLDARTSGEGEMLHRMNALGLVDDETGDGTESDLAQDEPSPLDARVEQRINHAQ
jgi:hypothetical protein